MKLNPFKSRLSYISGILVIIIFCIFTFTALLLFPVHYTPINNWLSDLGNSSYNPVGFIFFNTGCILTGLLLFPFFFGLYKWYTNKKLQKNLLIVAQIMGFLSAFTLIMVGIFSEDYAILHWLWSASFFILLLFTMILTNIALLFNPLYKKWIFYYGLLAAFVDLFFIMLYFIPNNIPRPLFEWLAVFTSLGWIILLVYNLKHIE